MQLLHFCKQKYLKKLKEFKKIKKNAYPETDSREAVWLAGWLAGRLVG